MLRPRAIMGTAREKETNVNTATAAVITIGASERSKGVWIPYRVEDGKRRYYGHLDKKTRRGAMGALKRQIESSIFFKTGMVVEDEAVAS